MVTVILTFLGHGVETSGSQSVRRTRGRPPIRENIGPVLIIRIKEKDTGDTELTCICMEGSVNQIGSDVYVIDLKSQYTIRKRNFEGNLLKFPGERRYVALDQS